LDIPEHAADMLLNRDNRARGLEQAIKALVQTCINTREYLRTGNPEERAILEQGLDGAIVLGLTEGESEDPAKVPFWAGATSVPILSPPGGGSWHEYFNPRKG
jgi:hypothetical protein